MLLFKTDSRAALGWLGFVVVFPLVGPVIYWLFGVNRIHRKARGESVLRWSDQGSLPKAPIDQLEPADPLRVVGWNITGRHLTPGNIVTPLFNGEQAYPEMLDAIARAQSEVFLATYIFDRDATGLRFVEALTKSLRRSVQIRILIDDVGRRYSFPSILRHLRRAGLPTECFMPLRLLPPSLSINLRNHRKLLVVDRTVAFAGGMNIGDRQLVTGKSKHRTADLHFRLEGPVVNDLCRISDEDWELAGGDPSVGGNGAPDGLLPGVSGCRVIADGPDEKLDHLALLIEGVISAAQHTITVVTPYFLPEKRLVGALQSAALRGVEVAVLIPRDNNWPMVRWALGHSLWELSNVGVVLYEQPPPFAHAKCLLIDDRYTLIGSANVDARSLRLNFELGIEVFDESFNQRLRNYVEGIQKKSRVLDKTTLERRGVFTRLRDALTALFAPYL